MAAQERKWWMDAAIGAGGAIVGAAVGALATYGVASLTLGAESERQAFIALEDREQEARELRRPAYTAFLDKADQFATSAAQMMECIDNAPGDEAPVCSEVTVDPQTARNEYQGAINDMHMIGTPRAIEAMTDVAATLPPGLIGLTGPPVVTRVDWNEFQPAYEEFARVAACDTNPTPIDGCEE